MAIGESGIIWRQIRTLLNEGRIGTLPDEQLLEQFARSTRRGGRSRLRGVGPAARPDGPGRLPSRAPRPARGRGCVPGHVPDPGPPGRGRSGSARSSAAGSAGSPTGSRLVHGCCPSVAVTSIHPVRGGRLNDRMPCWNTMTSASRSWTRSDRLPEKYRLPVSSATSRVGLMTRRRGNWRGQSGPCGPDSPGPGTDCGSF